MDGRGKSVLLGFRSPGAPGYLYTGDLRALDSCIGRPHPAAVLAGVTTPLDVEAWEAMLAGHPDRWYARYIVDGLRGGFRIGADRSRPVTSAASNMPSALQHERCVTDYLEAEREAGRMLGPFAPGEMAVQINRVGVIPKGQSGRMRLITDLSYPPGYSVNDAIDPASCSLTYTTVERVAQEAMRLGRGALMAKVDIKSAYRLIPVHPQDRPLLGVSWRGSTFVDPMLPFGLRSAPKIFNAVADAIHWCVERQGVDYVDHYLDDFIVLGPPHSSRCQWALDILLATFARLGVPLAVDKTVGPIACLTFLGIVIDTVANELRLPADKLERLRTLLASWGDRKTCSQKELESLIGVLNHACKVVRPGRSFLRRMLDLLKASRPRRAGARPVRFIRLNRDFRSDLCWWRTFAEQWNGVAIAAPVQGPEPLAIYSDASGAWGCAAWAGAAWFQLPWDANTGNFQIAVKELIPIVIAAAVWGRAWRGRKVWCWCDNQAVVAALTTRSSREGHLMHMLRCLFFIEAHYQFQLSPLYLSTHDNHVADDLSRNRVTSFFTKVPGADPRPTPIPPQLIQLLLDPQLDWVSPAWTRRFSAIIAWDLPSQRVEHTAQR